MIRIYNTNSLCEHSVISFSLSERLPRVPIPLPRPSVASGISAAVMPQQNDLLLTLTTNEPAEEQRRTTRFKLWELQDCWHCMVIGTCLTLSEVRQQVSKSGSKESALSDYGVHRLAVERAANRDQPLTQHIQRLLDRKHQTRIRQFRPARDADSLRSLWTVGSRNGDVAGSLWALLTHPRITGELIHDVFGEVHMMSHLAGARACGERERLLQQERRLAELEDSLQYARRRQAETSNALVEEIRKHELTSRELTHLTAITRAAHRQAVVDYTGAGVDRQCLEQLREKNSWLRQQLDEACEREERLLRDHRRLERLLSRALEDDLEEGIDDLALCGRCVLYLGGKASQCRHFQALVESCEGRFLHHDGGLEASGQRIADLVQQADAVLCPTDCVSHSAMKKARRLCARQAKPMIFMQRASLATFARGLAEVVGRNPPA